MAKRMVYYVSWEEDDWLDEILDRFPEVNALVPTAKSLKRIREQRERGEVEKAACVVNVSGDQKEIRAFLDGLVSDERLSGDPLFLVGMKEAESDEWQRLYPQARVAAVPPYDFTFDYGSVLSAIEAEWGDAT